MPRPIRERLKTAADLLQQTGHDDEAADVRAILAPGGWSLLRAQTAELGSASNLPIYMPKSLKGALVAAAADLGVSLSAVVRDGFQAVVDGQWVPPKTPLNRGRDRKPAGPSANLNVRVPDALRQQVEPMLPSLKSELGYRVSLASIAISWMCDELGVERTSEADSETLKVVTDRRLVDHVVAVAAERGVSLQSVIDAGIRALLDGSWSPQVPEWLAVSERPREGGVWAADPEQGPRGPVPKAKVSIAVDERLLSGLRDWCAEQSEQSELPYYPGMVAVAILKDRLGEPPNQ
ncbi:hypothetical protein [Streptomyces sp. NPDC058295]|uniref:hypothetical protein n=1 Tax=Streptomyces sp. NPDC058295 TaxID=3346431 RepID=UPI0036DFB517